MKRIRCAVVGLVVFLSLVGATLAQSAPPTIKVLLAFPCDNFVCPDGYYPTSLTEGSDGNFYGTAAGGGSGLNAQGTVFKITPGGQVTVLYSFAEQAGGALPFGSAPESVIEGIDGFLYGTTLVNGQFGEGTFFRLSRSGVIDDLHDFCHTENCEDGANPSFFMQALDRQFYGSTGPNPAPSSVLYRISPTGNFTVLHEFDPKNQPDGTGTFGFFQAADGNFYGTTVAGAQNQRFNTVFSFNPASTAYTILHGFSFSDYAASNLIQASNGNLFGLQINSELYEISSSGKFSEIAPLSTKQYLDGVILQASDGNLWGDFQGGDCGDQGMAFAATTAGAVLQNLVFDCMTVGETLGPMLQAADGKLYGLTYGDGGVSQNNVLDGTIWVINAGLPPPSPTITNFSPTKGNVGTTVLLQGQHFVGTTAVSFNGVSAKFKVLAGGYIGALVPSGATSGVISVTNRGGTTESTKPFTVE